VEPGDAAGGEGEAQRIPLAGYFGGLEHLEAPE